MPVARTLSHRATFVFKFLLPAVWIPGFGYGTWQIWTEPGEVVLNGVKGGATAADQWLFLGVFLAGTSLLLWLAIRLKRVRLVEDGLEISNYFTTVRVPFRNISAVRQRRFWSPRTITVQFRIDTPLGSAATFLPQGGSRLLFWREDELVNELRTYAGLPATERGAGAA